MALHSHNGKAKVIEKLLKLGFSNECIGEAMQSHTWIDGGNASLNLQVVTDLILSKQVNKSTTNKKRKLSEISDTTTNNSDTSQPLCKRTKLTNNHQKYYDDMIQLLNEGVISYSNSKKQIRTILEQKYNFQRKYLKRNNDFITALNRIVDDLRENQDEPTSTVSNQQTNKTIKQHGIVEAKTLRDLKAELSSRSGGCTVHALGHHLHFKKLSNALQIHCNLCPHSLIQEISLPSHLKEDTAINIGNDNICNDIVDNKVNKAKDRKKKHLNEWNCYEIIHWMNRVDNGKLNNMKYKCLKKQIKIGNIKGYELTNINDTTLKLIGIKDVEDRKIILNYMFGLVSNANDVDINMSVDICGDASMPDSYCDPISYEIMEDPVLVTVSGHTYERKFIEEYVKEHRMDPITQEKIELKDIVSNRALKESIQIWKSQNTNK